MLKTILKSVREYKKPSFLAPLFVGLESLVECIMPFIIAQLINSYRINLMQVKP